MRTIPAWQACYALSSSHATVNICKARSCRDLCACVHVLDHMCSMLQGSMGSSSSGSSSSPDPFNTITDPQAMLVSAPLLELSAEKI